MKKTHFFLNTLLKALKLVCNLVGPSVIITKRAGIFTFMLLLDLLFSNDLHMGLRCSSSVANINGQFWTIWIQQVKGRKYKIMFTSALEV